MGEQPQYRVFFNGGHGGSSLIANLDQLGALARVHLCHRRENAVTLRVLALRANGHRIDGIDGQQPEALVQPLTEPQKKVLLRASKRERRTLFPMPGLPGDAGTMVHQALVRRGYATDESAPVLTPSGITKARELEAERESA